MEAQSETGDLAGLLWLIAAGDHVAFRRLYEREGGRLYAVALRVTADAAMASEALHQALLQIWRRGVRFRPDIGTPEGWLIAHVRGRAIELIRRRHRDGLPADVATRELGVDAGLARLSDTPERARMAQALAGLDAPSRDMLILSFLDGLSAAEVAQRLRLPIGTVKNRTRQSLGYLRAALEPVA
jgi:RNA polymerase sigma-70 factor (ECF subfamily)